MNPLMRPYKTAYHPQMGLEVPLAHLLGNRIGIYLEDPPEILTGRKLHISAWKFKDPSKSGILHKGRFHIAPVGFAKITLIEDLLSGDMPEDFPKISERTTTKDLVNLSLFYPSSGDIWNFKIHMDYTKLVDDPECELMRDEVLVSRNGWTEWECLERVEYRDGKRVG